MEICVEQVPFAQEFVTDAHGQVRNVILNIDDYPKLLEALDDEGLYRSMQEVRYEIPFSMDAALEASEQP